MVTSRAVVGSSAMSTRGDVDERHRDHHALDHSAGELVGIGHSHSLGIVQTDLHEHFARALATPPRAKRRGREGSLRFGGRRAGAG